MKFGVLRFPGSCDEFDALAAARRVGDAELIWHAERDLHGADAVIVPGGFSYGDYLRAGAIARFAPAMESVIAFARAGGLVLGICNGFQVLCEAQMLPGALLPNANLRFTSRQVQLEVVEADTPFTRGCTQSSVEHPRQALLGALLRRSAHAAGPGGAGPGRAALRAGRKLQRLAWRHRRRARRGGQRVWPDAPPRARDRRAHRGSSDGLCIFRSMRLAIEDGALA